MTLFRKKEREEEGKGKEKKENKREDLRSNPSGTVPLVQFSSVQ